MAEVFETFSTYLARLEQILPSLSEKRVIVSMDISIPRLIDGDDNSIVKTPIAWPLYAHNMFYIVSVPAGKHIPPHSHDEDIFRLVIQGTVIVNKTLEIKEGQWFVVRRYTPYEIETPSGYTTLAGYTSTCRTNRGAEGLHLIEE